MVTQLLPAFPFAELPLAGVRRLCLVKNTREGETMLGAYRLRHGQWQRVRLRCAQHLRPWHAHEQSLAARLLILGSSPVVLMWEFTKWGKRAWDAYEALRRQRDAHKQIYCAGPCSSARRRRCMRDSVDKNCPFIFPAVRAFLSLRALGIDLRLLRRRDAMRIARWAARHAWEPELTCIWRILAHTAALPRAQMLNEGRARSLLIWAFETRARAEFQNWAILQARLAGVPMRLDDYGIVVVRSLLVGRGRHSAVLRLPPELHSAAPHAAVAWTFRRQPRDYHPEVEQ